MRPAIVTTIGLWGFAMLVLARILRGIPRATQQLYDWDEEGDF